MRTAGYLYVFAKIRIQTGKFRKKCQFTKLNFVPFLTGTCKGLQKTHRVHTDGDYLLTVRGRKVQIYCHQMNSTNPQEYISLRGKILDSHLKRRILMFQIWQYFTWKFLNPTDDRENYSQYFDRRSRNKDECLMSASDQWVDASLASGLTYFSKVRIDLHSLQVIIDDFTFARTSGRRQQPFGSAGDCFSATQRCPQGAFSINLENTKFRIRPKTRWETRGMNAIQHFYGVSFISVSFLLWNIQLIYWCNIIFRLFPLL